MLPQIFVVYFCNLEIINSDCDYVWYTLFFIRNYFINIEYKSIAPVLCFLYNVAVTAGFTSTRVECLFSALNQIDTPQRRSMTTKRECELSYLSFENKVLFSDITFDMFLKAWKSKSRKLSYL